MSALLSVGLIFPALSVVGHLPAEALAACEKRARHGWHRRLVPDGERAYRVLEDGVTGDHVIEDWRLGP